MGSLHDHLGALNAERKRVYGALDALYDSVQASHPGKPMTADEKAVEARHNERSSDLEGEISRLIGQEQREQESTQRMKSVRSTSVCEALLSGSVVAAHVRSTGETVWMS